MLQYYYAVSVLMQPDFIVVFDASLLQRQFKELGEYPTLFNNFHSVECLHCCILTSNHLTF